MESGGVDDEEEVDGSPAPPAASTTPATPASSATTLSGRTQPAFEMPRTPEQQEAIKRKWQAILGLYHVIISTLL